MFRKKKQKGIALIVAMLFVMVFSALSVAMFSMSSGNSLVASNLHKVNAARSSAESGLEVVRYYLQHDNITILGSIKEDSLRFAQIASILDNLDERFVNDSGTAVSFGLSGSPIELNSDGSDNFYAVLTPNGSGVNIAITGQSGQITRKIAGGFTYGTREHSVFDYGVASKGAVQTSNISLDGTTLRVEADMYIESMTFNLALDIKNSQIAGDVEIVNPNGYVAMSGNSSIGGETGENAFDHVEIGVPPTEFPLPNTSHFEQFVSSITIDSTNIDSYSSNATLDNVRIAAEMGTPENPLIFDGSTTVNGVMYIEQPNVVKFAGTANINGVIVGDGSVDDNSGTNQLIFEGTVNSSSVASLDESFGNLRDETGTFVMAPGFAVSMGGDFGTLNGCIACNGFTTYGQASGTIGGSIVNYSPNTMVLGGGDLYFNRSGVTEVPAGFEPETVIYYDPSDYDEIL